MADRDTSKYYADQLQFMAQEFYQTYEVLKEVSPPLHGFLAMKHFLLCHAFELTVKAWLVDASNYNEKKLKDKFGHDLVKLTKAAKQVYVTTPELDACVGFINVLNEEYRKKGYEYPINYGRFIGTDHEEFSTVLKALMDVVSQSIHSYKYPPVKQP